MPVVIEEKKETVVRQDWTKGEIADIYHRPLLELVFDPKLHAIIPISKSIN